VKMQFVFTLLSALSVAGMYGDSSECPWAVRTPTACSLHYGHAESRSVESS
jgi:hypothetical protein